MFPLLHPKERRMFERTPWILLLFVAAASTSGCGLFSDDPNDDPLDVVIRESVPLEFKLDSSDLCPPTEDCSVESQPSPTTVDTPPVEIPAPIDIIEATGNQQLADAADRLKSVEIESIDYEISPNSLNVPSPEIELYMAPLGVNNKDGQAAFYFAKLPSADPMATPSGTVPVEESARDQSSELFKDLKFTAIAYGDRDVQEGELFPPQGATDYKLTLNLKFTANPVDQFNR